MFHIRLLLVSLRRWKSNTDVAQAARDSSQPSVDVKMANGLHTRNEKRIQGAYTGDRSRS